MSENKDRLEEFHARLRQENLGPLWEDLKHMVTKEPVHHVKPHLWKWETVRKLLLEAGDLLPLDRGSERRVIYLQNPSLPGEDYIGCTTLTLYAGVQLILPGEVAPSHRHTQGAIRFIIEGSGAYTAVDGEKVYMNRGDMILTPQWTWHDHGHEGTEPMIWMDGLDVGLVRMLSGSFYEPHASHKQPIDHPDEYSIVQYASGPFRPISERKRGGYPSPLMAYRWEQAREMLEKMKAYAPDPFDGYAIDYMNPVTGGSADFRIGSMMQLLTPGMHTKAHRHVHSAVYHVLEGSGYTVIDGVKYEWSKGDFLALPPWCWHEHVNTGEHDAYLFSFNDRPVLTMLALEREEAFAENGGQQTVQDVFTPQTQPNVSVK
ncbi:gentisate 1,2-dioxygenase [Bacillaceae bacterium]